MTVVAATGTVVVATVFATMLLRQRPLDFYYGLYLFQNGPSAVVLLWMGRLILRRQPGNGAGLTLVAIAVIQALHVSVALAADLRLTAGGLDLPFDRLIELPDAAFPSDALALLVVTGWLWVPAAVLAVAVLPLVFPDGHLLGPRWRTVLVLAAIGTVMLMVGFANEPAEGQPTPPGLLALTLAGAAAVLVATSASFVALMIRWRRADAAERHQFRVVGITAAVDALVIIAVYPWQQIWVPAVHVTFNALIIAYALAVARYRLHDLEPVLGRAAVAAILSALVAAVYLVVVVGAGRLVSYRVESTWLPLVAVGAVALLVEPVRRRARRLVDRVLYDRRSDRTEVLSRLAARSSTSAAAGDVLSEVVELLVRSTGAARSEVWLDSGSGPRLVAEAGESREPEPLVRSSVAHDGERLGELRLYAHAAADLVPDASQLLDDVAHALGVVLRNERLTARLRRQLDEIQASRTRLVEAQDQARRGLERDIHDGAQSRLISLRLQLGVLRARTSDRSLAEALDSLGRDVDMAVRSLRDLARGLHPPILEQAGVAAALRAHVRGLPVPVTVRARGDGRYRRAVEGAAYFACLEAVQNAARHSRANQIVAELDCERTELRFEVRDDGTGFEVAHAVAGAGLASIDDRVSALGGTLRIDSAPGNGTVVVGTIPAHALVEDR